MSATRRIALLALWDLYVREIRASRIGSALLISAVLRSYGLAAGEVAHGGAL